MILVTSTILVF